MPDFDLNAVDFSVERDITKGFTAQGVNVAIVKVTPNIIEDNTERGQGRPLAQVTLRLRVVDDVNEDIKAGFEFPVYTRLFWCDDEGRAVERHPFAWVAATICDALELTPNKVAKPNGGFSVKYPFDAEHLLGKLAMVDVVENGGDTEGADDPDLVATYTNVKTWYKHPQFPGQVWDGFVPEETQGDF